MAPDGGKVRIREAFEAFGAVQSVAIIKDKFSGESRGFGFVEMPNKKEGDKAIPVSPTRRSGVRPTTTFFLSAGALCDILFSDNSP